MLEFILASHIVVGNLGGIRLVLRTALLFGFILYEVFLITFQHLLSAQ